MIHILQGEYMLGIVESRYFALFLCTISVNWYYNDKLTPAIWVQGTDMMPVLAVYDIPNDVL